MPSVCTLPNPEKKSTLSATSSTTTATSSTSTTSTIPTTAIATAIATVTPVLSNNSIPTSAQENTIVNAANTYINNNPTSIVNASMSPARPFPSTTSFTIVSSAKSKSNSSSISHTIVNSNKRLFPESSDEEVEDSQAMDVNWTTPTTNYFTSSSSFSSNNIENRLNEIDEDLERKEKRARRFEAAFAVEREKKKKADLQRRQADLLQSAAAMRGQEGNPDVIDWDQWTLIGTCTNLEKRYLRLTSVNSPFYLFCFAFHSLVSFLFSLILSI